MHEKEGEVVDGPGAEQLGTGHQVDSCGGVVHSPDNLGVKWKGPFIIVDRPTNTTVTIRVGYNKQGFPRMETHSWNNLRIAHLRPNAVEASKPDLGRPSRKIQYGGENDASELPANQPPNEIQNKQRKELLN